MSRYASINGAVSDDTLEDANRSYVFARGNFLLPDNYQLAFDIETVSDPAYLRDYGYSDKDRLDSAVSLLRVTDQTLYQARLVYYETLREDEVNTSLPICHTRGVSIPAWAARYATGQVSIRPIAPATRMATRGAT